MFLLISPLTLAVPTLIFNLSVIDNEVHTVRLIHRRPLDMKP